MNEEKYNELLEDGELFDYIEELQQENNKVKEELRIIKEHPFISKFYKDSPGIKCYMGGRGYGKTNHQLQQENHQLKEELQKANDTIDTHNELIDHLHNRIEKATNNLENSINAINEKLRDKEIRVEDGRVVNPPNDYRIVRLKGIRTKCKEILKILKGEENE